MNKLQVYQQKMLRGEEGMLAQDFKGNRPAVPPLMTEAVTSVIYLVEEDEPDE